MSENNLKKLEIFEEKTSLFFLLGNFDDEKMINFKNEGNYNEELNNNPDIFNNFNVNKKEKNEEKLLKMNLSNCTIDEKANEDFSFPLNDYSSKEKSSNSNNNCEEKRNFSSSLLNSMNKIIEKYECNKKKIKILRTKTFFCRKLF